MPKEILYLNSINKFFRTRHIETHALNNVNLSIKEGDFLAICGPSGGGKSTLLAILSLLDIADSGEFLFKGKSISKLNADDRARFRNHYFGIIFQAFNLVGDLNVHENVALPLRYSKTIPKSEYNQRISKVLEQVGLSSRTNHYPAQLSGGQQQRVAIARALVTTPAILFADEPTGNLDSENCHQIIELLQQLNNKGMTICLVTHDQKIAQSCHRQVEIKDGIISEKYRIQSPIR